MTLDKTGVVDLIATKSGEPRALLFLMDEWDWVDEQDHLVALQEKINAYVAYIEGGQLVLDYPVAADQGVTILAKFLHAPPESVLEGFLNQVKQVLVTAGIQFEWSFKRPAPSVVRPSIRPSTTFALVAVVCVVASLVTFYYTAYFSWLVATPLSPAQLERVRALASGWGVAFLTCVAGVVLASVLWWRARRR